MYVCVGSKKKSSCLNDLCVLTNCVAFWDRVTNLSSFDSQLLGWRLVAGGPPCVAMGCPPKPVLSAADRVAVSALVEVLTSDSKDLDSSSMQIHDPPPADASSSVAMGGRPFVMWCGQKQPVNSHGVISCVQSTCRLATPNHFSFCQIV